MEQTAGVRFETVFLSNDPPDDERTDRLISWCHRFDKSGLAPKSAGNLSFRTQQGFIITATGVALSDVKKDNLVEVLKVEKNTEQNLVIKSKGKVVPSKESILHYGIYDQRPEINAVFHIHDQLVVEFAEKLELPCTKGEQARGSYELAEEVNRVLSLNPDAKYIIIREHGVISLGETMGEAGRLVEDVNKMARNIRAREGRE